MSTLEEQFRTRLNGFLDDTGMAPTTLGILGAALPAGLSFDASTRTIGGTLPTVTTAPIPYTYKATDANGSADSLSFSVEVHFSVAGESGTVPESFAMRGTCPNPFRHSTRLVFDLPWPAHVIVEVIDLTGRRVPAVPSRALAAGSGRSSELGGTALSSGVYLYRLIATSSESISAHVGRFVHIR